MKAYRIPYWPLAVILLSLVVIYLIGVNIPESTIREIVRAAGPFGVVILIFFIWLSNVLAPLSATPFLFAGFYLYGPVVTIYSFLAAFVASITNFWIARIWGRSIVVRLAGEDNLKKADKLVSSYGLVALFFVRVFLALFHDVLSYLFGLTSIEFYPYLIISTLGAIPGTILWYVISTKIDNPVAFTITTLFLAYTFLAGYLLWLKFVRNSKTKSA